VIPLLINGTEQTHPPSLQGEEDGPQFPPKGTKRCVKPPAGRERGSHDLLQNLCVSCPGDIACHRLIAYIKGGGVDGQKPG